MVTFDNDLNSPSDEELTIRRIAILLRSLPTRTHRALLGQLSSDSKKRVSDAFDDLGEVDLLEQHRVLVSMHEQLHAETDRMKSVESEIQDEIFIGRARVAKKPTPTIHRQTDRGTHDTSTSEATQSKEMDHSPSLQTTVPLHAEHQASSLVQRSVEEETTGADVERTAAEATEVLLRVSASDAVRILSANQDGDDCDAPMPVASASSRDESSVDLSRPIIPFQRGAGVRGFGGDEATAAAPNSQAERVDRILEKLEPRQICQALGMVTAKQAFLVLCGLPNETAEAVLALLPRRKAKQVRADMRRIGKLQLAEIDVAKEVVVDVAMRMTLGQEAA